METNIAVYWDFENIHASLCTLRFGNNWYKKNRSKIQPQTIEVNLVMEFIAALGPININKAYADWSMFHNYSPDLQEFSIDLVQLFPRGRHGKNGADIRMAIDVIEDLNLHPHVETVVIIGGDSDYIAIAQKVRQRGKSIIGIGVKETTNQYWIKSCNEFKFYSGLIVRSSSEPLLEETVDDEEDQEEVRQLLVNSIKKISAKTGIDHVLKSSIKPMMMRLSPSFDESNYGYKKFGDFLASCEDIIAIKAGDSDHLISLRAEGQQDLIPSNKNQFRYPYEQILKKQGIRLPNPKILRHGIFSTFMIFNRLEVIRRQGEESSYSIYRNHLKDELARQGLELTGSDTGKIKTILFKSFAFQLDKEADGISLTKEVEGPEALYDRTLDFLIKRVVENVIGDIDVDQLTQMLADNAYDSGMVAKIVSRLDIFE
jgi:uncharacterized LabA/DUF88 family protein